MVVIFLSPGYGSGVVKVGVGFKDAVFIQFCRGEFPAVKAAGYVADYGIPGSSLWRGDADVTP